MTNFRYSLPPAEAADTAPLAGLSTEALTAMSQLAIGPSAANQLLGGNHVALSEPVKDWAQQELEAANTTLQVWDQYHQNLGEGTPVPTTLDQLLESSPNLASTLEYLYQAKTDLQNSSETNPDGENIAESLKLMVMPWQDIKDALPEFDQWVARRRTQQGVASQADYFNDDLLAAIKNGTPLYRSPAAPGTLISAEHYLSLRIAEDGPWGVALVQTSKVAGVNSKLGQSPNQLTADGSAHLQIADHSIDGLGIFEWIATTLQADPRQFSPVDVSWMLANRLEGGPFVPRGYWDVDQVQSGLSDASGTDSDWRPRLAVMKDLIIQ